MESMEGTGPSFPGGLRLQEEDGVTVMGGQRATVQNSTLEIGVSTCLYLQDRGYDMADRRGVCMSRHVCTLLSLSSCLLSWVTKGGQL